MMAAVRRAARIVAALTLSGLAVLLRWIPRSPRIVVVGSYGNAFADNSKYLFIDLLRRRPDLRVVWISGSRRVIRDVRARAGEAHLRWSPVGMLLARRAQWWCVSAYASDVNAYLSHGATLLNLWHGVPLKKIERDIDSGPLFRIFHRPTLLDRFVDHPGAARVSDYVITPSHARWRALFSRAFGVPHERCIGAAAPRIACLLADEARFQEVLRWSDDATLGCLRQVLGYRAFHLYMPTWRDSRPRFLVELLPHMRELNELMRSTGAAFVLKPHPNTPGDVLREFALFSNVVLVPPGVDAYPLLRSAATLVTDYSSVYFDFLFVNRRIVFFPFDLDRYTAADRGLYFDYLDHTPGPIARDVGELVSILRQPDSPEWAAARAREFAWVYGDGRPPESVAVVDALIPRSEPPRALAAH